MTTVARLLGLPRRPRVVLDIKGLLTHSYFSGKDLEQVRDNEGNKTNPAGYGLQVFIDRYLKQILDGFAPLDIIAVWDGGNAYRKSIFPEYKKSRAKEKTGLAALQEQELNKLYKYAKVILAYSGAINLSVDGVEADDVIALLTEKLKGNVMLYTVDQDLMQLASERVVVSFRDTFSEEQEYKGITPEFIPVYKSLVGDTSDEYPGVKGFGPKAFEKLLEIYGEEILPELKRIVEGQLFDELDEAARDNDCKLLRLIHENRSEWKLMYQLAKLHPELCYQMKRNDKIEPKFYTRAPDAGKVLVLLEEAGCSHLEEVFAPFLGGQSLADLTSYDDKAEHLVRNLAESPVVAFDFETYDPVKHQAFIEAASDKTKADGFVDTLSSIPTGGAFTYGNNLQYTFYVPELHRETDNVSNGVSDILKHLDEFWGGPIAVHNAAFECVIAKLNYGVNLSRPVDTMIMSSYVDENERSGLKSCSKKYLGHEQTSYRQLMEETGATDMRGVSGQEVLSYGCDDALMTAHLWKLFDLVCTLEGHIDFYLENETSPVHILNDSFIAGVNVDFARMRELSDSDKQTVEEGVAKIRGLLKDNCTEINEANAEQFFNADKEALRAKLDDKAKSKGWARDRVKAEMDKVLLEYTGKTAYIPLTLVKPEVDFKPTPAQIRKVIELLGWPVELSAKLKSASASSVTEFLMAVDAPVTDETQVMFLEELAAAAKHLNKYKESPELVEAFVNLCSSIMSSSMKETVVGDELNFGSPVQMKELFYLKLGLPVRERTKKTKGSFRDVNGLPGSPATDEVAVMSALLNDCPEGDWRRDVLKTLLDVKEAMTRESLFYSKYPHWVHPRDGVVHPSIRNCGTVTRRPTGGSPNLLQVSKGQTRSIFIPRYTGEVIISIDFSGQELRLTGSESKDKVLIDCYVGGGVRVDEDGMEHPVVKDVHSVTSCAFTTDIVAREAGKEWLPKLEMNSNGFVDYDFFRKVMLHDTEKNGPLELFGDYTAKMVKVFNNVRKMAKVVNFLLIYGGDYHTLAKKLGIPEEFSKKLMELVFKSYGRLEPWQNETIAFGEKHGYVQTAYGTRRHLTDAIVSRDEFVKGRMERQAVNSTIQGCLQAGSLVSTDTGLRPIESLVGEVFEADTGVGFFTATAIEMGKCKAARITTSSGLEINCDIRHKVKNSNLEWVDFNALKVGDEIALPSLTDSGFTTSDYDVSWPFVVGYWLGDGCLITRKGPRKTDKHFRTTFSLCGGETKKLILEEIVSFLASEGITAIFSTQTKGRNKPLYVVTVNRAEDIKVIRGWGVVESNAREKRIPTKILQSPTEVREEFLRGFLLADGARRLGYRVHTPNLELLTQLRILGASIGLDSTSAVTPTGNYSEFSNSFISSRSYPHELITRQLSESKGEEWKVPTARKDRISIADRRAMTCGKVSQKVAERVLKKYAPAAEVYRFDRVVSLEVLDKEVNTYTLSVDHPLHQFVADGVIHKNCAADILKVVLNKCYSTNLFNETKSTLIAPVYDETVSSVPAHHAVEYCFRMQEYMNITPPGHAIPMMGEVSIGKNWNEQEELGDHPSARRIEAAIERAFS